jgi:Uma2 family endonuclease
MSKALETTRHTLEEYLSQQETGRFEYYKGNIITCEEYTSLAHNQIVQNVADVLKLYFYPKGCRVYTENIRLKVAEGEEYRLPDVMATCAESILSFEITEPVILVEVLSPSTAMTDLAEKADSYRKIKSLQAYLIINPNEIWVRVYERSKQGEWIADVSYQQSNATIHLAMGLTVSVADLYRFVI